MIIRETKLKKELRRRRQRTKKREKKKRNRVATQKSYQVVHLPVILKLKLASDIEKNPGPVYERLFEAAKIFCVKHSETNARFVKSFVEKVRENNEMIPHGFLDIERCCAMFFQNWLITHA